MIDSNVERLTCGINAVLNGLRGQMTARRIPPVLEPHSPQSDYRNFFIGFAKTTVFHEESMVELLSVSKKIIELNP